MGVVKLVSQITSSIIPEIQVERTDSGRYVVTGEPEDYTQYISVNYKLPLRTNVQRIASLVKQDIDAYLNTILRVGAKPIRYGQSIQEIFAKAISLPIAGSANDLIQDIADSLGISIDTFSSQGQMVSAIYEYKLDGDMAKLEDKLKSLSAMYPELANIVETFDIGSNIPVMPGQEYEVGPGTPNIPAIPGATYEVASKTVPLKRVGQDEGEEQEFGEGPVKLPPPEDIEEYIRMQAEPGEEESVEELEDEFREQLEDEGVDPDALPPEELVQRFTEFKEEKEEEQREEEREEALPTEGPKKPKEELLSPEIVKLQEIFNDLTGEVTKQERLQPKADSGKQMVDRWFNILGYIPLREQNTMLDVVGKDSIEQLNGDLSQVGAERKERYNKLLNRSDVKDVYKLEMRKINNESIEEAARAYKDFIADTSLTMAGMHGLRDVQEALEAWAGAWYPELVDAMHEVRIHTNTRAPKQLPENVREWKEYIDLHRLEEEEVPREFLSTVPVTIDIETDMGPVTVPNPLYEQYPYNKLFEKIRKVPTYEEISPLVRHPMSPEYWTRYRQPESTEKTLPGIPPEPYRGVQPLSITTIEERLPTELQEDFHTILDWAEPMEESPNVQLRNILDKVGEDKNAQVRWIQQTSKATGVDLDIMLRIFEPVFRQEALSETEERVVERYNPQGTLDELDKQQAAEDRRFEEYLAEHNLNILDASPEEVTQALMDFKESSRKASTISLDQLTHTLDYLDATIDQKLVQESTQPKTEYFAKLPAFTSKARADLINLQDQLLGFTAESPEETTPLIEQSTVALKTLDEMDDGTEEFIQKGKAQEETASEEEKLQGYKDEFRSLYFRMQHMQDMQQHIDSSKAEIAANRSEIEEALKEYKGYKVELRPLEAQFETYLKEQGTEWPSDFQLLEYRDAFEKTLSPEDRQAFQHLTASIINLERGALRPAVQLKNWKEQMQDTQSEFKDVVKELQSRGVDPETLITTLEEIPKSPTLEERFQDFLAKEAVDPSMLTPEELDRQRDRFYEKVRREVVKEYRKRSAFPMEAGVAENQIVYMLANFPYTGKDPAIMYEEVFAPLVKVKRAEDDARRQMLAIPPRPKIVAPLKTSIKVPYNGELIPIRLKRRMGAIPFTLYT